MNTLNVSDISTIIKAWDGQEEQADQKMIMQTSTFAAGSGADK